MAAVGAAVMVTVVGRDGEVEVARPVEDTLLRGVLLGGRAEEVG